MGNCKSAPQQNLEVSRQEAETDLKLLNEALELCKTQQDLLKKAFERSMNVGVALNNIAQIIQLDTGTQVPIQGK